MDKKILQFKRLNSDLAIEVDGVLIRFVEIDDWYRVMIEVDEDATHEALKKAIPFALQWRDRLIQYQGPWLRGGSNYFLYKLDIAHRRRKKSYGDLAKSINSTLSEYVREYLEYRNEVIQLAPELEEKFEDDIYLSVVIVDLVDKHHSFGTEHSKYLLEEFGYSEREIEQILRAAITDVIDGFEPFQDDYPVYREKVINALRKWRRSKQYKAIVEKNEDYCG
jgi:hypothetical protein